MSFYLHEGLITAVNQTIVCVTHFYVLIFDSLKVLHLDSYEMADVNVLQCIVMESRMFAVRICRLMSFFI